MKPTTLDAVFRRTRDDNQVAPSIQDMTFMEIMDEGLHEDSNNSWVAPIPFKSPRPRLADNRPQALRRLMSLKRNKWRWWSSGLNH